MRTEIIRTLDLWRSNSNTVIYAVQNDTGARYVSARITQEGYDFKIPNGASIFLSVTKPDGKKTLTQGEIIADSIVSVELTNQTLALEGFCDAQIEIVSETKRVSTPPCKLCTFPQVVPDDTVVSTDEYNALLAAINATTEKIKVVDSLDLETNIANGTYLTKLVTYKEASLTSGDINGIYAIVTHTGNISLSEGEILNVWCFKDDKIYKLNYETKDFDVINKTATVDSELSSTSANPVESKAVKAELDKKLNLSGGTISGNLDMSNHPITNLATPTADHHAVNKAYVDEKTSQFDFHPATLLDTTTTEEVAQIEITTINGKSFNCSEFYIQLDIPATATDTKINCNIQRKDGSYQGINAENSALKTTTDSGKHNLIAFSYEQFGNVYWKSEYGGQIAVNGVKWTNMYNNVPLHTISNAATLLNETGISGIKLTGLFPVGTVVKVWGGKVK